MHSTTRLALNLRKVTILGTNGVAVAPYGPIFSEDGATGSRKVFRYLWGLPDTITKIKNTAKVRK